MKIFVISVYKSLFEDVKKQPSKNVEKKCNKKEMMPIMLSRRIQLHFHFMYFIPIEFSNARKNPWTMFSYYWVVAVIIHLISKWNFESWYATKYRYFNKTYMITFLHLKMGKSLHESETSNDNDIVYGVLVEIWLELIIQNRAREKKENLCERNPK